jgi:tripartite motif-containing protein 71
VIAPAASADPVPLAPIYGTGTAGGAAGQLNFPVGVSVDAAGQIYVDEFFNHRISVFTADGTFVRAFGFDVIPGGGTGFEVCTTATTCKAGVPGGGAGQLNFPGGISTDAAGNLYVGDAGNNRISVFTADGTFLRAFGFDVIPGGGTGFEVCTTTTGCKGGDNSGGGAGQLNGPKGVSLDAAGNLYVADQGHNRISVFTADGTFLRAFGFDVIPGAPTGFEVCTATTTCKAGVSGGGAGQFSNPPGVGLDAAGNLYVADQSNNRISVFHTDGTFLRAFGYDVDPGGGTGLEVCTATTTCKAGVAGGGAGQLSFPQGVSFDAAGNLYVADQSNNRISVFTADGTFVRAFGFDVIPGGGTGFEVCTTTTSCKAGVAGTGVGQLSSPAGVASDCRGAVFVAELGNNRVQRFGEPATALPPCPPPPPPSNQFSFGKLKLNTKKGTAKLTVELPGPGELVLAGKGVKSQGKQVAGVGDTKLSIKAKGKASKKLTKKGKVKLTLAVTFTPTGGEPNERSKKVKLKRKR